MRKFNPHAFPRPVDGYEGMTLLDWFAGQALAGMLADHTRAMDTEEYAAHAYEFAVAMLHARREY